MTGGQLRKSLCLKPTLRFVAQHGRPRQTNKLCHLVLLNSSLFFSGNSLHKYRAGEYERVEIIRKLQLKYYFWTNIRRIISLTYTNSISQFFFDIFRLEYFYPLDKVSFLNAVLTCFIPVAQDLLQIPNFQFFQINSLYVNTLF